MSSPAERVDNDLENAEFERELRRLAKVHTDLLKLATRVYKLPKNKRLTFPDGTTLGRGDLKNMSSEFKKQLKALKKHYVAHGKKKRKRPKRERKPWSGFDKPVVVKDELKQFFVNGNFGSKVPGNPSSGRLQDGFLLAQDGVTTRAILTKLMTLYIDVNNIKYSIPHPDPTKASEGKEVKRYRADQAMRTYFANAFNVLKINPDQFEYKDFQRIISPYVYSKEELVNTQWAAILDTPDEAMKARLTKDSAEATRASAYYKDRRD